MGKILISADHIPAAELLHSLQGQLPNADLSLEKEGSKFRGGVPWSDPEVIAAIAQAGGTLIAAIIAALAMIYTHRKKEDKSGPTTTIHIHTSAAEPALRLLLEDVQGKSAEQLEKELPQLAELEERVTAVRYLDDE